MEPESLLDCSQGLPLVPILSQMNTVHTFPTYFPKIHSNIIFQSVHRSSEWFFISGFPIKILYAFLISYACYIPRPSHPSWYYHPNNIRWSLQVMKLLIMQSSPASRHFPLLCPNILLSNLFSDTSIYVFLWVCWTKFHTHTNKRYSHGFVYFNLYVFRKETGKQKT
jgi:hypothetical protein